MKQTISSLLTHGENTLRTLNLPAGDARLLVAYCLGVTPTYVLAHGDRIVPATALKKFYRSLDERTSGFSVAAICGYKYFFGLKFQVSAYTLIPRPESELLVERALKILAHKKNGAVLDVGTGSGALIVSIAKNSSKRFNYIGCDISGKALSVARSNARGNGVSVRFYQSDLLSRVPKKKYTVIVANLPYLTEKQLRERTIAREPRIALHGGRSGIELYESLLSTLPPFVQRGSSVLIEMDPRQRRKLTELVRAHLPQARFEVYQDLAGRDRMIDIRIPD